MTDLPGRLLNITEAAELLNVPEGWLRKKRFPALALASMSGSPRSNLPAS
jgi:hypothetical protein